MSASDIIKELPKLSPEELDQVEATLRRLRDGSEADARFDGAPWPASPQETATELAEADALPPLLSPPEADRLDAWLAAERERQKALSKTRAEEITKLFT